MQLVPPMGFEPTISALRGRCPRPLDDGGLFFDDTGPGGCGAPGGSGERRCG